MMDNSIAAAPAGIDAKALGRTGAKPGKQEDADTKGGFGDTLSNIRDSGKEKGRAAEEPASVTAGHDAAGEIMPAQETPAPLATPGAARVRGARPLIDIQSMAAKPVVDEWAERAAQNAGERQAVPKKLTKAAVGRRDAEPSVETGGAKPAAAVGGASKPIATPADGGWLLPETEAAGDHEAASAGEIPLQSVMSLLGGHVVETRNKAETNGANAAADHGVKAAVSFLSPASAASDTSGGPEDTAAGDKTFRFARANGKGQAVELTIPGGARANGDADGKKASAAAENITVLDSRRYLGLAQNANSTAVVAALSGNAEWSNAMHPGNALSNAAALASTGRVVNTLKIQMHPIDLGVVTATMRLTGDELSVHLTVETGAAYRQLSDDQSGIVDSLRAQGFAVDHVTVTLVPAGRSDDGNNPSPNGQNASFSQQTAQDGGGTAPRRDDRTAARQQAADTGRTGNEASDTDIVSSSGGSRPDYVYI